MSSGETGSGAVNGPGNAASAAIMSMVPSGTRFGTDREGGAGMAGVAGAASMSEVTMTCLTLVFGSTSATVS